MRTIIITTFTSIMLGIALTGCRESEETKRNLEIIAREAEIQCIAGEKAEADRKRKIEEARKWHRIQMEAYEKSMTPAKK